MLSVPAVVLWSCFRSALADAAFLAVSHFSKAVSSLCVLLTMIVNDLVLFLGVDVWNKSSGGGGAFNPSSERDTAVWRTRERFYLVLVSHSKQNDAMFRQLSLPVFLRPCES